MGDGGKETSFMSICLRLVIEYENKNVWIDYVWIKKEIVMLRAEKCEKYRKIMLEL